MDESFAEYLSLGGFFPTNSREPNAPSGSRSQVAQSQLDDISQEYFDAFMTDPSLASMFTPNLNGFSQPVQAATPSHGISGVSQSSPSAIESCPAFPPSSSEMSHPQATFSALTDAQSNMSQQPQADAQLQLEILRETRRIRELELSIMEEKRRAGEVLLKQREAELALVNANRFSSHAADLLQTPPSLSNPSESSVATSPLASYLSLNNLPASSSPDLSMDGLADLPSPPATTAHDPEPSSGPRISPPASEASPQIQEPSPSPLPSATQSKKKALIVDEREARCLRCSKVMAKLLLRGSRSELDAPCQLHFQCEVCEPVFHPRTTSKKRTNQLEDTTLPTLCSVCARVQGQGGFVSKDRTPLLFTVEVMTAKLLFRLCHSLAHKCPVQVICIPCSHKYKR